MCTLYCMVYMYHSHTHQHTHMTTHTHTHTINKSTYSIHPSLQIHLYTCTCYLCYLGICTCMCGCIVHVCSCSWDLLLLPSKSRRDWTDWMEGEQGNIHVHVALSSLKLPHPSVSSPSTTLYGYVTITWQLYMYIKPRALSMLRIRRVSSPKDQVAL